jgi:tetratricopeptide (TPR) repeat protein
MVLNPKVEIAMKTNCWKSIFLCLVSCSILFFALPSFAQESTLQVKCVDSSGAPVPGVKVSIAPLKTQKAKDKKSDPQGIAEFTKIEDGAYRVFGRKDGLAPALYEFAVLKGSQASVTLKFTAGPDRKLWFEDPAEDQKAAAMLANGLDAGKQNKISEAEKLFNEALLIKPSSAEAYYYLGMSLMQQAKFDEGVQALDKASELANIWLTAPPQGPNAYPQIIQSVQQAKKNLPAAKASYALSQKNYELASKLFSDAIKDNPNDSDLHANLAIALAYSQKYDEAMAAINKAIQLKPGETYEKYKSTIATRKEDAEIKKANEIMREGNQLLKDGDAAAALKKFDQAKSMVPAASQSPIWAQIGRAQAKLNQPEAVNSFKKAIELAPADKPDSLKLYKDAFAQYYLDAKKFDEAIDLFVDPKSASLEKDLLDLAKAQRDKQTKLSEAALERVLKINPENIDACFDLGQLYYSEKDKDSDRRAKELLTKYAEKGTDQGKLDGVKGMLVIINRRTK